MAERRVAPKNWGRSIIGRLVKTEEELDAVYAQLRSVVAQGKADSSWTGWIHAVEMLIPDSGPRMEEFKAELRAEGLSHLAIRIEEFQASITERSGDE